MTYFPSYRYELPSYLNDPYSISLNYSIDSQFAGYLNNPIEVITDLSSLVNWFLDVVLDLNNLKDCTNLKELSLQRISNIKNAKVLKELPNLENIILDEYASIWLDLDTLKSLPLSRNMKTQLCI